MRAYSDPKRENNKYAMPDIEIFWQDEDDINDVDAGYYYWFCFPGCLPDSDAIGPFKTEQEALEDARMEWKGDLEQIS